MGSAQGSANECFGLQGMAQVHAQQLPTRTLDTAAAVAVAVAAAVAVAVAVARTPTTLQTVGSRGGADWAACEKWRRVQVGSGRGQSEGNWFAGCKGNAVEADAVVADVGNGGATEASASASARAHARVGTWVEGIAAAQPTQCHPPGSDRVSATPARLLTNRYPVRRRCASMQ